MNTVRVDAYSLKAQKKNHRFQKYTCGRGRTLNPNLVCLILKPAFNGTWARSPCKHLLQSSRVIFPDSRPIDSIRILRQSWDE